MTTVSRALLLQVLELACRAPSVHNSQPWCWRIAGRTTLELHVDPTRQLLVADPDGRDLAISCGAALHHAVTAAAALGLTAHVDLSPATSSQVAALHLAPGSIPEGAAETLTGLRERCTDRRRFTAWPIPDARLLELSVAASGWGAYAVPLTEQIARTRVEHLIDRARSVQAADPRFATEQRAWIVRGPRDGVPAEHASPPSTSRPDPRPGRFQPDAEVAQEVVTSTDGLLAICTADDGRTSWVQAGQTLSALWLLAHRAGLSVVPLSQVVEVPETRRALRREVFHGGPCPQLVVRVGWQQIGRATLGRTGRRPLEDVLLGQGSSLDLTPSRRSCP